MKKICIFEIPDEDLMDGEDYNTFEDVGNGKVVSPLDILRDLDLEMYGTKIEDM